MNLTFKVGKHSYHGLRVALATWLYPAIGYQLDQKMLDLNRRIDCWSGEVDAKIDRLIEMREAMEAVKKAKL